MWVTSASYRPQRCARGARLELWIPLSCWDRPGSLSRPSLAGICAPGHMRRPRGAFHAPAVCSANSPQASPPPSWCMPREEAEALCPLSASTIRRWGHRASASSRHFSLPTSHAARSAFPSSYVLSSAGSRRCPMPSARALPFQARRPGICPPPCQGRTDRGPQL